ncbi:MAG: hypothetical protein MSG64_03055 [Pyrinomonadaceae bacterium MAG19_C2-C3]|nr:hypothetical protein [Pyrinomonadaceae bacterium MAG19_C2-C3]
MNQHTSPNAFKLARSIRSKTRSGFVAICLASFMFGTVAVRAAPHEIVTDNFTPPRTVVTQNRDWLTDEEDMRVREAQEIDKRIDVFVKVIERRLSALKGSPAASKQNRKDTEKYGELRTGTPPELLSDIVRALNAAVDNIDDASSRPAQKILLPKAFEKLQAAARTHRAQFSTLRDNTKDTDALRLLDQSIEITDSIIAAHMNTDNTKP